MGEVRSRVWGRARWKATPVVVDSDDFLDSDEAIHILRGSAPRPASTPRDEGRLAILLPGYGWPGVGGARQRMVQRQVNVWSPARLDMPVTVQFEIWYREEHRRVLASCVAVCGDLDAAIEATDEAFSRALARWDRVSQMTAPGAWVCRVALNYLKRSYRRRLREVAWHLVGRSSSIEPQIPSPELWAAVRALPSRQRMAVVLRYVADLPEADIGLVMNIARGTVAATLAAARTALAAQLADQDFDKEQQHAEP